MPRIDYDEVAHLYDEPSRDHTLDSNLLTFLEERDTTVEADVRLIDIGCGTGKQLAADHQRLPVACLVGIDRFQAMLRIGQKRCPSVGWIQADGAALPLASASVDYATSQFSSPTSGAHESSCQASLRRLTTARTKCPAAALGCQRR